MVQEPQVGVGWVSEEQGWCGMSEGAGEAGGQGWATGARATDESLDIQRLLSPEHRQPVVQMLPQEHHQGTAYTPFSPVHVWLSMNWHGVLCHHYAPGRVTL